MLAVVLKLMCLLVERCVCLTLYESATMLALTLHVLEIIVPGLALPQSWDLQDFLSTALASMHRRHQFCISWVT